MKSLYQVNCRFVCGFTIRRYRYEMFGHNLKTRRETKKPQNLFKFLGSTVKDTYVTLTVRFMVKHTVLTPLLIIF